MKDNLTHLMFHEKKTSSLRYIIYTIIFLLIIEQIYTISLFTYKYCNTFDYGKLMEKTCESSYVEFETDRFQISKNIMNMVLQNDIHDTHYNLVILIVSVVVVLVICSIFIMIFLESITGGQFLSSTINFTKSPKGSLLIQGVMEQLGRFLQFTLLDKLLIILKIILTLYIVLLIPVTIAIKYIYDIDISPFQDTVENIIVHTIFLLPVIFFTYTNAQISVLFSILFMLLFFVAFFYIMTFLDIYNKQNIVSREANRYDNSDNDILKEFQFSTTYFDDIDNTNSNIVGKYIKEIFGLNDVGFVANIRNGSLPISANIVNFKGLIFFIIIVLLVLGLFYILLSFKPDEAEFFGMVTTGSFDADTIYYFAIVPFVFLFVIMFIIVATKEFNTYINKYILYKPNNLYKRHIEKINKLFNQIIENDNADVQNNSVCTNVANATHMVVYSNIFHHFEGNIFTPEFIYNSMCEVGDYIEYDKIRTYNFDKYIKENNVNIFYDDGKCTSVDNNLILAVIKSSIVPYNDVITNSDYDTFKESFIKQLKFSINNIKNKKNYTGDRALILSNEYKSNNTIKKISPTNESYTFDEETLLLISNVANEYMRYIYSIHNYCITVIQALTRCNNIDDFTREGYNVIMEKLEESIQNSTNGNNSLNIKKEFINKFTLITHELIDNINTLLSKRIKIKDDNRKLTKYIIKNYNIYQHHDYRKYQNDTFITLDKDNQNKDQYLITDEKENLENVKTVLSSLYTNIGELNVAKYEREIETKKIQIKDNLIDLNSQKRIYIDSYKNVINSDDNNNNYYMEILHEYNIEFIDRNIKLHNNLYKSLQNRDHIGIFSYDFKFNDVSSSNLFDTSAYSISKNDIGINFDVYSASYNSIMNDFEKKYATLHNIAYDRYKTEQNKHNYRELEKDQEEYSHLVLKMADNTSTNVYTLLVVYFIAIYIANLVK